MHEKNERDVIQTLVYLSSALNRHANCGDMRIRGFNVANIDLQAGQGTSYDPTKR